MRVSRLRESAIMCNEPGCLSAAAFLVDSREEGGRGPEFLAAYCGEHVKRFLPEARADAAPPSERKRSLAAAGAGQARKLA